MTSRPIFSGSPAGGILLLALLGASTLFSGCGDKEADEGLDTSTEDTGTEDTEPPEPEVVCPAPTLPAVLSSSALSFTDPQKYTGYAAAATADGAVVADSQIGLTALLPWDAADGALEDEAAWVALESGASVDLITVAGDWLGVSDGGWDLLQEGEAPVQDAGSLRGLRLSDVGALTDADFTTELGPWAWMIRGDSEFAYVGSMLIAKLDGDDKDDVLTSSSPLPGELAMWSDVESLAGEVEWASADLMTEACWGDGRNIFAPTSYAVFGSGDDGDGWLAVGCPGSGYGGSQIVIFALPLVENAEPVTVLGPTKADSGADSFAGWWLASAGPGFPLYADNRRDGELVIVRDDPSAVGAFTEERYTSPDGAGTRFGATPAVYVDEATGCGLLAVGDQSATLKGDVTGAVYLASLTGDGTPYEWVSLALPSTEGIEPLDAGGVVRLSADGQHLVTTGSKWGGYLGGYVGLFSLSPLE